MANLPARRTLADVVASLGPDRRAGRGSGRTIFAEQPWSPGSPAVVLDAPALRGRAPSLPSYAELLDVHEASEVLVVWSRRRSGAVPSPEEAAEALIHYAAQNSHLPSTCQHLGCGREGVATCFGCRRAVCSRHAAGSAPEVACTPCSARSAPPDGASVTEAARAASRPRGLPSVLLVAGLMAIGLSAALRVVPLLAVGICVVVIAACVWLFRLVQRIMA